VGVRCTVRVPSGYEKKIGKRSLINVFETCNTLFKLRTQGVVFHRGLIAVVRLAARRTVVVCYLQVVVCYLQVVVCYLQVGCVLLTLCV
jgi:hypothetical protein